MITRLEIPSLVFSASHSYGYGNTEEGEDQEPRLWNAWDEILQKEGVF